MGVVLSTNISTKRTISDKKQQHVSNVAKVTTVIMADVVNHLYLQGIKEAQFALAVIHKEQIRNVT